MDDALIAILFVCMICICFIVIGKMNFDFINIKVREGVKKKQQKKVVILLQPPSVYLPTPIVVKKATF